MSDSSLSWYRGMPLSVRRVIEGCGWLHPIPNTPLPLPESYATVSCGPNPERPGLVGMGTLSEPVPVTGLAVNFSSMPRMAPPPLGRLICGATNGEAAAVEALPADRSAVVLSAMRPGNQCDRRFAMPARQPEGLAVCRRWRSSASLSVLSSASA